MSSNDGGTPSTSASGLGSGVRARPTLGPPRFSSRISSGSGNAPRTGRRTLEQARRLQSTASIRALATSRRNLMAGGMADGSSDYYEESLGNPLRDSDHATSERRKSLASAESVESWLEEVKRLQERGQLSDGMLDSILSNSTGKKSAGSSYNARDSDMTDTGAEASPRSKASAWNEANWNSRGEFGPSVSTPSLPPPSPPAHRCPKPDASAMTSSELLQPPFIDRRESSHGFDNCAVLEQYRLMAQLEASAHLVAELGYDPRSQRRGSDRTDGKDGVPAEISGSTSGSLGARPGRSNPRTGKMPKMREGRALPTPRPVGPPGRRPPQPFTPYSASSYGSATSDVGEGMLVSSSPPSIPMENDQHPVKCLGCGGTMTVRREVCLAVCSGCSVVSPATTLRATAM